MRCLTALRFKITEDHIRGGERHDENRCIAAEAIYAAHPYLKRVRVGADVISFTDEDGRRYKAATPATFRRVIEENDDKPPEARDLSLAGEVVLDLRRAEVIQRPATTQRKTRVARKASKSRRGQPRARRLVRTSA